MQALSKIVSIDGMRPSCHHRWALPVGWLLALGSGCAAPVVAQAHDSATAPPLYRQATAPQEARIADLLSRMTLAEKIGQMTQAERGAVGPAQAAALHLGSVLSGGGSAPQPNTPAAWAAMTDAYQQAAAGTRLGIPLLYGIDAVHGHQSVTGATLFPHLLGLAASRDAALLRRVGQVTAREMAATGVYWNFSPMVAVSEDLRWGRTYESFGEDPALVSALGRAYAEGLMDPLGAGGTAAAPRVLPTAKHFIGDGATGWDSAARNPGIPNQRIDQGDTRGDTAVLLARHLPPYQALVDAGVLSVMASFSSWNGHKLHGHRALLTGVLKEQLGFGGFVVSDWDALQQLPGNFRQQVVAAVNAGIDMAMVPTQAAPFVAALTAAVQAGEVSPARIDDAVRRILRAKFATGAFEQARALPALQADFGGEAHRRVARQAVAQSVTLLKNDGALPLAKTARVFVAGEGAHDRGAQAGGWTLEWQGVHGNRRLGGTSLLTGLQQVAEGGGAAITYDRRGRQAGRAEVGVMVIGESPYAEGAGDRDLEALRPSPAEREALAALRAKVDRLVLIVMAGRPLLITDVLPQADAVVMVYLPGSEGAGVADVLFGDQPFTGRLPLGWPLSADAYRRADAPAAERCAGLLWSAGYGLDARGAPLGPTVCP
jgi:beta-glucosidase